MTDTNETTLVKEIKNVPSAMEKIVEIRFLVLMATLLLYTDIWFLRNGVDPRTWTLATVLDSAKLVSIPTAVFFVLCYSMVMVGLFPFIRFLIGWVRLSFFSSAHAHENRDSDAKRLSDWSLAFVALSIYDLKLGIFTAAETYRGVTLFIASLWQSDSFEIIVLRLSAIGMGILFVIAAMDVDN